LKRNFFVSNIHDDLNNYSDLNIDTEKITSQLAKYLINNKEKDQEEETADYKSNCNKDLLQSFHT
jgi:hypothetical protein